MYRKIEKLWYSIVLVHNTAKPESFTAGCINDKGGQTKGAFLF